MTIAVAATGESLDARVCRQLARCHCFLIVDLETLRFDAFCRPTHALAGSARRTIAEQLADRNVDAVLAGSFCRRSRDAFRTAGLRLAEAAGRVRDVLARESSKVMETPGGQPES
jgi:predicted Fe-Mo cluster-binding NifX family protein